MTRDFTLAAQDFIRSNGDHPFFLYLAHAMPHEPIHASEAFRGKSEGGLYGDAVEELDWSVGQILHTLVTVRHERWKYYRRYVTDNAAFWPLRQGPFLFDLELDPSESYSLIESQPERAAELSAMLDAFEAEMAANLRGWL